MVSSPSLGVLAGEPKLDSYWCAVVDQDAVAFLTPSLNDSKVIPVAHRKQACVRGDDREALFPPRRPAPLTSKQITVVKAGARRTSGPAVEVVYNAPGDLQYFYQLFGRAGLLPSTRQS